MTIRRATPGLLLVSAAVATALATPAPAQIPSDPRERALYVSVLDRDGRPVPDLVPADFIVREDGVPREVLRVSRATDPMDIAVLIDDSQAATAAISDIRDAVGAFVDELAGDNQLALVGLGERPTLLADYTRDAARLKAAIGLVFARPGSGAHLLDAIVDVSRGMERREPVRPVIVAISTEGREFSDRDHTFVIERLLASGAAFHAFTLIEPGSASDLADYARQRSLVLDRGTRETGGRRDDLLSSMALANRLRDLAVELRNQYYVIYFRPETLIPPERVSVGVNRSDLVARGTPASPRRR